VLRAAYRETLCGLRGLRGNKTLGFGFSREIQSEAVCVLDREPDVALASLFLSLLDQERTEIQQQGGIAGAHLQREPQVLLGIIEFLCPKLCQSKSIQNVRLDNRIVRGVLEYSPWLAKAASLPRRLLSFLK